MQDYDFLMKIVELNGAYARSEITSKECTERMARALNEYKEELLTLHDIQRNELVCMCKGTVQVNKINALPVSWRM